MKIEIDPHSGFCFGVVRAIGMAERELAAGASLVSLGDIVHNEAEVARLAALGLRTVGERTEMAELAGETVLIRAHGEPPSTYASAERFGVTIVDATCPVVAALQRTVASAFNEMRAVGGQVVIFGRRGHAEVRGLLGHARVSARVMVVESAADLSQIDFSRPIYFLAQTTGSLERFWALASEIERRALSTVTVRDTICRQVADREAHIGEFAARHDVVVFVAGAKSSNGAVLFEAARRTNPRSYKVQNASELRSEWFAGAGSVGVCGSERRRRVGNSVPPDLFVSGEGEFSVGVCGATSTPRWLMESVAAAISQARAMATSTSTQRSSDGI